MMKFKEPKMVMRKPYLAENEFARINKHEMREGRMHELRESKMHELHEDRPSHPNCLTCLHFKHPLGRSHCACCMHLKR
jgi:poly-gamma-glutamate capsule biosynthesis protein CapA/YwtB (metallophosphatase superfamily)